MRGHESDLAQGVHSGAHRGFRARTKAVGAAMLGLCAVALMVSGSNPARAGTSLGDTGYVAVTSARLLDTRAGSSTVDDLFAGGGALGPTSTLNLKVTGRGGVPASGVGAVVLNVTAVDQSMSTYLTVFPKGANRPLASNLNLTPGVIQPNLVIAQVGADGEVSIFNDAGTVNVIADVQGWFPSPVDSAYHSLVPARILESRSGFATIDGLASGVGALGAGQTLELTVVGRGGVPAFGVAAVAVNITATNPTQHTFLTAYPTGALQPNVSNLNPSPSATAANLAIVQVGADGKISIFNDSGSVDLVVDVQGWFPSGLAYTSVDPARLLETRAGLTTVDGQANGGGALSAASTTNIRVAGRGGVPPTGVSAVVLNVTATNQTENTFLTVFPAGDQRPATSNLNPSPGMTSPNLVFAEVGSNGEISVYNHAGNVDVIIDVFGWLPADIVANDDAFAVTEDAAATALGVLSNDVDNDGGSLTIASVSQPPNGLVTVTGGVDGARTGLTYTPDDQFCNTPPGTTLEAFTYTLNGGFTASVAVAVNCVDDSPVALDDTATVAEDAPATAVAVRANDTDIDGGPLTIASVTQPLNGTVAITGGGTGLTYEPDAGYCTTPPALDTFVYTLNGGSSGNVGITVTCADDAPIAVDDEQTFVEDDGATSIPVLANDTDVDAGLKAIASATDPDNGTVVLTGGLAGSATGLTYQPDADYCNAPPETALDTFDYTLIPGGSTATVTITVTCVNDAPVVTASAGSTIYGENDAPTVIDGALTVVDVEDIGIASATVTISTGLAADDLLSFDDQLGITGTYSSGTGVLTLTGTAPVADYQTALRSVSFSTSDDDPPATKTIAFVVNDGDLSSNTADGTKTIDLTAGNDDPTITTTSGALPYEENDGAVVIDSGLTVADPDSPIAGATVSFTSNGSAQDELAFADQLGISGVYNDTTGVLTLSGTTTVANYQTALRSVTYANPSDDPSTLPRTVTFQVTDSSAGTSNLASRTITFSAANDAPVVVTDAGSTAFTEGDPAVVIDELLTVTDAGSTAFTEGDPAVVIDELLTVTDADDTDLEGAAVSVSDNLQAGDDVLVFTDQLGITGTFDSGSGTLTLAGSAPVADYEVALRTVAFRADSESLPSTKTLEFMVTDSDNESVLATKTVAITAVNDAPVVTVVSPVTAHEIANADPDDWEAFIEGTSIADVDSGTDNISVTLSADASAASIAIRTDIASGISTSDVTGNGGSSVTIVAPIAAINATFDVGDAVVYTIVDTPGLTDVVTVTVDDLGNTGSGGAGTDADSVTILFNRPPSVVVSAGLTSYSEGALAVFVDTGLTVSDPNDTDLEAAIVSITGGFQDGDVLVFADQNGITGTYSAVGGELSLTGSSSVANYQAALRTVAFANSTNDDLGTSRAITFMVGDGELYSTADTKGITVTPVNDAPVLDDPSSTPIDYTEDATAVVLTSTITVADPDDTTLDAATVSITAGNQAGDLLEFVDQGAITGDYDSGVLTLTGVGTRAEYQAALRSITFRSTNDALVAKSVSFAVADSSDTSNVIIKSITITGVNDAPVVGSTGSTTYTENGAAELINSALTVTDVDDTNLESGTASISAGFEAGDTLTFVDQNGIIGSNNGSGVLTLTGSSTVANYRAALRSVRFSSTSDNPSTSRVVTFVVSDGDLSSSAADRGITIVPVNDAPAITTTGTALTYPENQVATAIDTGLTLTDAESDSLSGATVSISAGFTASQDVLAFVDQNGIVGSYNPTTGVLTLSGTATVANYRTALRSVTYFNSSNTPTASRTISFQATDVPDAASNTATRTITITAVNDAPVNSVPGAQAVDEDDVLVFSAGNGNQIQIADIDAGSGAVKVTVSALHGTIIPATGSGASIVGSGTGSTEITGTVAQVNAALSTLSYTNTANYNTTLGPETLTIQTNDQGNTGSIPRTDTDNISITINPINDAPTMTTTATPLGYTENGSAVAIDPTLTSTDLDLDSINGATVSISSGFSSSQDELGFVDQNGISSSYNSSTGVLSLSGEASAADYETALRSVTYFNSSNAPTASRTISFQVTDTSGAPSNTATRTITITAVNDAPVNSVPGAQAVNEDDVLVYSAGNGNQIQTSDVDAGSGAIRVTVSALHGTITPATGSGAAIVGSGTASAQITGTLAQVNAALSTVNYANTANYNTTRGPETLTMLTTDQGNTGGSALTDTDTISITINPLDDAPIAAARTYGSSGTPAVQTNMAADLSGLLVGATDPDSSDPGYVAAFVVENVDAATSPAGGTVTLTDAAAGTFHFDPPPGVTGAVTFTYRITNGDLTSANATNTVYVGGPIIWFADDSVAPGGTGTMSSPFNTLASAVATIGPDSSERIFLYDGTYPTGIQMRSFGWIVGQQVTGTSFDTVMAITPPVGTVARPAIATGTATVQGTVELQGSFSHVHGLRISTTSATALGGVGGFNVSVTQTSIASTNSLAIFLVGVSGTISLTDLDKNGSGSGIVLADVNANITVPAGATIAGTTNVAVEINTGTGSFSYAGTISNASGRTIDISNRNGTSPGLVQFTGAITGAGTGIRLDNNDTGPVAFSGGLSLSTGTNVAFSATNGGSVTATQNNTTIVNTISTTTGTALTVDNTTIGAAGLTFRSIAAGTTGGGPAKAIALNTTGVGALTVTGVGTTDASGGTIQDAAAGSTMQRGIELISAQNVSLNNMALTNASRVQGAVSDGTYGGTENRDENGAIHLQNVANVSLTNVDINGAVQHGINGNVVSNLDITNSTILNTGDAAWESGVYLFNLRGTAAAATGSVFSSTTVQDSGQFNVRVQNNGATNGAGSPAVYADVARPSMDVLTLNTMTFADSGNNVIGDHVSVVNTGTANFRTVVTGSGFTSRVGTGVGADYAGAHTSDGIQVDASETAHSDFDISTSTFSDASQAAINISAADTGFGTFSVHDNSGIQVGEGSGIVLASTSSESASLRGSIAINTIATNSTNNSGSGIQAIVEGNGRIVADVNNNIVVDNGSSSFEYGLRAGAQAGSGTADLTLSENFVFGDTAGFWLFSGNGTVGETSRATVKLAGNNVDSAGSLLDYLVEMHVGTTFQVQDFSGAGSSASEVASFVAGTDVEAGRIVEIGGTIVDYSSGIAATP